MTTRRPLTAQIKPATRNAIMDQLALAASEIERLRWNRQHWRNLAGVRATRIHLLMMQERSRPLWQIARDRIAAWWRK